MSQAGRQAQRQHVVLALSTERLKGSQEAGSMLGNGARCTVHLWCYECSRSMQTARMEWGLEWQDMTTLLNLCCLCIPGM
jgi:hypothetical protein